MSFGGPHFVLAIIAMSFIGWIITTAIRAKHGYPIENEWVALPRVTARQPMFQHGATQPPGLPSAAYKTDNNRAWPL